MAELGGSPTECSTINLESTMDGPSTSNPQPTESTLKRPAESGAAESLIKRKKSAEEMAGSSKGRNVHLRQKINEEKKKQKQAELKDRKEEDIIAEMMETRERLLDRLLELEEREMCDDMAKEDALVKREDKLRKSLVQIEALLKKKGVKLDEQPESVPQVISISLPKYPALDHYLQDFAMERIYSATYLDESKYMSLMQLKDMIMKVKSRNPNVQFPSEDALLENLLMDINIALRDAARERRYDDLQKVLEEYPGFDETEAARNDEIGKEKEKEKGDQKSADLKLMIVMAQNESRESGTDSEIEVIDLEKEEDKEKEGDDDEMEDELDSKEGEEEEEDEDEDVELLRIVASQGCLALPPIQVKKEVEEETKEETADPASPLMPQSEATTKPEGEEGMGGGSTHPTLRDEMEGGTSTNSPTIEREEERKREREERAEEEEGEMEEGEIESLPTAPAVEDSKQDVKDARVKAAPARPRSATIVLDDDDCIEIDDDDEEDKEEEEEEESDEEEEEEEEGPKPPVHVKLPPEEAWKRRKREIQDWVNTLIYEREEDDGGDLPPPAPVVEERQEDDDGSDVEILLDDFEMDSVSHSGLRSARNQLNRARAEAADQPSTSRAHAVPPPPIPRPHSVQILRPSTSAALPPYPVTVAVAPPNNRAPIEPIPPPIDQNNIDRDVVEVIEIDD